MEILLGAKEIIKENIINSDLKSNYHTHTYYCDGKNSPREMVEQAIKLGFRSLGFSGHQFSVQDSHYAMSPEKEEKYIRDIEELKEEYKDKIKIYLGLERDYCCDVTDGFDYIIGSSHHVKVGDTWMNVDESSLDMESAVEELFDGDYMAYSEAYYDLESSVLDKTKGQIVGHFDLVTVFNEGFKYFDEDDSFYQRLALKSADNIIERYIENKSANELPPGFPEELGEAIIKTGMPIFEINTGAMAKGRKTRPYPAPFILEHLAKQGVPLMLNSDCHDLNYLDFGFKRLIYG